MLRQLVLIAAAAMMGGCLWAKPSPPKAPCVYEVRSPATGSPPTGSDYNFWEAEADLVETSNQVTFTNCWDGMKVTVHGTFSVEAIRR